MLAGGECAIRPHRWVDVAIVFQGAMNALNPVRTVGARSSRRSSCTGWRAARPRAATGELLESVGIPAARAGRFPHELSGGMRQRAAIAMALACNPKVLIADEPTTALDVMVQAQILELLDALCRELGLALLLVTHDLPVVAQLCDRSVVMYAGRVVGAGTGRRAVPRPEASVHAAAVRGDAGPRRSRGADRVDPGRAAAARPSARRLPVSAEVRPRVRPVRRRAGPRRGRRGPHGRLSPDGGGGGVSALLEVEDLVVHYPVPRGIVGTITRAKPETVHAVDGVSFGLAAGEMVALVGESGCGKTSTAQAVMRLVDAEGGAIRFEGRDLTGLGVRALRPLRRRIQMVYQDPYESLDPRFRVRQAVEEPLAIHRLGGSKEQREGACREALARVGADAARALPRPVSARALRRSAPARGDRGGARPRAGAARRGRARLDARRLGSCRRPGAARLAEATAGSGS